MKIKDIINEQLVKLTDLYDDHELNDESEAMYNFIDDDDLERDFEVHTMSPKRASTVTTHANDATIYQAYKDFATREAKNILDDKIKHWDANRIVVLMNNTLLDGNHHLVAGINAGKPIKYIDLAEYI